MKVVSNHAASLYFILVIILMVSCGNLVHDAQSPYSQSKNLAEGADPEKNDITIAKEILSGLSQLEPVEGTDYNVNDMAKSIISIDTEDVSVTLFDNSSNSNIDSEGNIAYNEFDVIGNVVFLLTKDELKSAKARVMVQVPANDDMAILAARDVLGEIKSLGPVETVDVNILDMAMAYIAWAGLKVSLSISANSLADNIGQDGTVTFSAYDEAGAVEFKIYRNTGTPAVLSMPVIVHSSDDAAIAAAAESLEAIPEFLPEHETDVNIIEMATEEIDKDLNVVVSIANADNNENIDSHGSVTYNNERTTGNVVLALNRGTGTEKTVSINVIVPYSNKASIIYAKLFLDGLVSLNPAEGINTNILEMAQNLEEIRDYGVELSLFDTANNENIDTSGDITYDNHEEPGIVIFAIDKGSAKRDSSEVDVIVPAGDNPVIQAVKEILDTVILLEPVEWTDSNILDMLYALIDPEYHDVDITVYDNSINQGIETDGHIIYDIEVQSGDVEFAVNRGAGSQAVISIDILVPHTTEGNLTYIDKHHSENELDNVYSIAISSDGKYVYVPVPDEDSVAWFSRSETNGGLSLTASLQSIDIAYIKSIVLSPDGKTAYAAASEANRLVMFNINSSSGGLEYGIGYSVAGFPDISDAAISSDGKSVYAITNAGGVAWFARNASNGELVFRGQYTSSTTPDVTDDINGASSITISPDNSHVYITAFNDNAVAWFARNSTTDALSFAGRYSSENLYHAKDLVISPDGKHAYVINESNGISCFTRNALTGGLTDYNKYSLDTDDRPAGITISSDNNYVYLTCSVTKSVIWLSRNTVTGSLSYIGRHSTPDMYPVYTVTLSPNENHVYAGMANTIAWFSRNPGNGELSYIYRYNDNDSINSANSVNISPDGKFVYVTAPEKEITAWFSRDKATGELLFKGRAACFRTAEFAKLSPNGKHLYIAAPGSGISWLTIDPGSGALIYRSFLYDELLDTILGLEISPDNRHIYAATNNANGIAWFTRNDSNGDLQYEGHIVDDIYLNGSRSITISPDGKYVYAASDGAGSICGFIRNIATGTLTNICAIQNTDSDNALFTAISPDGKFVYLLTSSAIVWYSRDNSSGEITFIDKYDNDDYIENAVTMTISPTGNHIYTICEPDHKTVTWFRRNKKTGDITRINDYTHYFLQDANAIAVPKDGNHVYIAAETADAVAWFWRDK